MLAPTSTRPLRKSPSTAPTSLKCKRQTAHGLFPWARSSAVLTQEIISEAMARAEKAACAPGDSRCYAFPDPLAEARASCTPKGRCLIGWIVSNGGRDSWDVWLDVNTGEGRLRRRQR